jgi:gamma-glutamyl:cysteine ligase YbdK (ATP-grasp superfamily)
MQNSPNVYSSLFQRVGYHQRNDVLLDVHVHAFVPLIETAISIPIRHQHPNKRT